MGNSIIDINEIFQKYLVKNIKKSYSEGKHKDSYNWKFNVIHYMSKFACLNISTKGDFKEARNNQGLLIYEYINSVSSILSIFSLNCISNNFIPFK